MDTGEGEGGRFKNLAIKMQYKMKIVDPQEFLRA
jgi:hypothetical protein